ncbi:hypothetical protein L596_000810 [Steinernema carpocapsae]|uniref:Uncharacterized protein n=1 Tax=Steinernema carpocapsae TaxID=34508 RepID=A0A4U8UJU6_STECR|nr:hypothetical protein L596_000810 [Steinernema carpocapsae]
MVTPYTHKRKLLMQQYQKDNSGNHQQQANATLTNPPAFPTLLPYRPIYGPLRSSTGWPKSTLHLSKAFPLEVSCLLSKLHRDFEILEFRNFDFRNSTAFVVRAPALHREGDAR